MIVKVEMRTSVGLQSGTYETSTTTVRKVLEDFEVDYNNPKAVTNIDGAALRVGDVDKTLADLGISKDVRIATVIKGDGAGV